MRIAGIRLVQYRIPFRRPYVTAGGSSSAREGIIVEIKTDAGVVGLGECALLPDAGGDFSGFVVSVREAAAAAIGRELAGLTLATAMPAGGAASAGIEIAGWDALGRQRGLPVARLLSAEPLPCVPVNALITARDPDEIRAAAAAAGAAGYTAVKLKAGVCATVPDEVARVAAAREALGADIKLRLDANGAWPESFAVAVLRAVARYDIEYVEQPVAPGDIACLRRVREFGGVPVAADEDVTGATGAERLIEVGAADYLVLKPVALGGIGPAWRIALAARDAGLGVTVTTGIEAGVATAAALHLAAALDGPGAAGLATLPLLEASLIQPDLAIERGVMALPSGPGLGVELDAVALARYAVEEFRYESP